MRLTHPAAIEREIQRQIARVTASQTRACLFNLVIFKPGPVGAVGSPADPALDHLLGRRPARLILVEGGYSGSTEAAVSARCHPRPNSGELCFQEIRVLSGQDGIGRDPGFWSPLLIRDIPTFVWWLRGLAELRELLPPIEALADRLLVASGYAEELGEDPAALAREVALRMLPESLPCADFAWRRAHPLRLATARLFDPPEARVMIPRLRAVRLSGGRWAEALLYFLWLASRLGWRLGRLERGRLALQGKDGEGIQAEHEAPGPLEAGLRLTLASDQGKTCSLECGGGGCGVLSGAAGEREAIGFRVPSAGEILLREVDAYRADPLYGAALAVLARAGLEEA